MYSLSWESVKEVDVRAVDIAKSIADEVRLFGGV